MPGRIVIVGANAAGVDAASAARKTDRAAQITLFERESRGAYSRCGLPFVLGGHIPAFENLVVYPPAFYKMMKLDLRLETTVTGIDPKAKTVEAQDKEGRRETFEYDSLILATGSNPLVPPIKGADKEGVYTLKTIEDGKRIDEAIRGSRSRSAVVVGGSFLGLESAVALVERGMKTTVVELLPYLLPKMLDQDMAKEVQDGLERKGMRVIVGHGPDEILVAGKATGVSVAGEEIPADFVVMGTGVRPNVDLAKQAGLEIGPSRAIKTNARMETSAKGVYAAGDCAEVLHMITHEPLAPLLGTTGVRQGKVAGINAAGGYAVYPGTLVSAVTRMLDFEVGATGLTEFWAARYGIETAVGRITSKTRADYYPGAEPIKVKIIVEKETRRVVGAQIVGGEEVTQRINALSLAIQKQMTVHELAKADTCYAPPVNETWEPITLAAEMAIRQL